MTGSCRAVGNRRRRQSGRPWAHSPDVTALHPASLNILGNRLMQAGRTGDAVGVLEFAAARYPQSASLQDSLADAYEKAGNVVAARAATERSQKLIPADSSLPADRRERLAKSAEERLKRLASTPAAGQPR